jgi:hypothetical protein
MTHSAQYPRVGASPAGPSPRPAESWVWRDASRDGVVASAQHVTAR